MIGDESDSTSSKNSTEACNEMDEIIKLNTSIASKGVPKASRELIAEMAELNRLHLYKIVSKDKTLCSKCPRFEETKLATRSWARVKN